MYLLGLSFQSYHKPSLPGLEGMHGKKKKELHVQIRLLSLHSLILPQKFS